MQNIMLVGVFALAAAVPSSSDDFLGRCVSALEKTGRPEKYAKDTCDCVARETTETPQIREEFLTQLARRGASTPWSSSQRLRQVDAICVAAPIWIDQAPE